MLNAKQVGTYLSPVLLLAILVGERDCGVGGGGGVSEKFSTWLSGLVKERRNVLV